MKLARTLPTSRLVAVLIVALVVLAGGAVAIAATKGSGPTPPPKPLADAIHDALAAPDVPGITARISFVNNLFPSGALTGQTGSALMTGASGRLWASSTGGRLELQSDAGDVQVVWDETKLTAYDASSNTAYSFDLPQHDASTQQAHTPPSLTEIQTFLNDLATHWNISSADPTNQAGEPAYSARISPSHDGGLLGAAELVWDATKGVPLKVAIYAQGSSTPALALEVTDISFGPVASSDIHVAPPAGAKIVDLSSQATSQNDKADSAPVTGLAAVQAAAPFTVVAPDSLVGLPRQDVRLVGPADSRSAIVVYGQGLGAVVIVERAQTGDTSTQNGGGMLSSLPSISLDGVTAHELATQLGTVLGWNRAGVSFILAGSVPTAAAEAAARALK